MANNQKKYASLSTLSTLVDNIKNLFATKSDLNTGLSGKADSTHKHSIGDTTNLQSTLDGKVPTTRTINSKPLSANITLSASDVGAATSSHTHDDRYYTETEIDTKLSGKSDTTHNHNSAYDSKGSAAAVQTNLDTVSDTLDDHTSNTDVHFTATERTKLSGIQSGAQVNTITGVKGNSESTYRTGNVNITKTNIGLGNVDNTADANKTVKHAATADSATSATKATQDASGNTITSTYETKANSESKLATAKQYTDTAISNLINSAPTTLDTLGEIATAMQENEDVVEALETSIGTKANASDLTSHANNKSNPHGVTLAQLGVTATVTELNKLDGVTATTAELNILDGVTATATELSYMDGVTSNVQAQLDSLSSNLENHEHSASDITSGTMDAARLPKASGTAAGIMSTGTQTIAGTKTFTSQIKPAGVLTSGHITASADSTYDIGSTTSAFKNAYINSLYVNPERVNSSVIFGGSFEVEKAGTDTQVGIAKLKVGNPTKEGTAGNAQGFIQIYNENNGSVTLQTDHDDDYAFRVNLPRTNGRLMTNNEVYTIEDHTKTLIYDSGEITSKVHSISNIEVYGYTHFLVAVACVNDGSNISKSGSAIFKSNDGTTYQFPVWTNMFSTSADVTSAGMAQFEVIDGYIMCPFASRNIRTSNFFSDTEGGTADNLTSTGSGIMKCTKAVKYLTISSLDQDSSCWFGVGSRVMVWGWNA